MNLKSITIAETKTENLKSMSNLIAEAFVTSTFK
jgi:hypothetical protein